MSCQLKADFFCRLEIFDWITILFNNINMGLVAHVTDKRFSGLNIALNRESMNLLEEIFYVDHSGKD